jgi:pathogenesis-related protein 1
VVSRISGSRSAGALLVLMCTALGCADSDRGDRSARADSAGSAADGGEDSDASALAGGASAASTDDTGSTSPTQPGAGTWAAVSGESGRLVGITAAHNAVRASQAHPAPDPVLPPLTYSAELAATAQAYAEKLANGSCELVHSMTPGLGENLGWYAGQFPDATAVVDAWAAEAACYTFGHFMKDDACDVACTSKLSSNGCGHYTQVVWRDTMQLGCGVASCARPQQGLNAEIWVCNYKAPGNYIGEKPY